MDQLFREDMLGDDLDAPGLSALMKRTFRANAQITGLVERAINPASRTADAFSTDHPDVLRSHEPDHSPQAAADATTLDIKRLADAEADQARSCIQRDAISPFACHCWKS
jgi:hypothetical protein